jgi:hypothetical protein
MANRFLPIVYVFIFKCLTIIVGFLFCLLGYKLFMAGLLASAGDLHASDGSKGLDLKNAAPGTFFSLFGAIIVIAGIWKGFKIERKGEDEFGNDYWEGAKAAAPK